MTLLRCDYFLTQIHKSTMYYNIVICKIVWVSLLLMHYLVCLISLVIIRGKGNIKVICQTNTMIVNWNDLHSTNWHFGPLVYAVTSGTRTNKWCMHYRTVTSIGCHPPVSHHHPPPSPIPSQVRIVFVALTWMNVVSSYWLPIVLWP